ncbi:MAG: flagellin, partial [Nitrospirota bacterium]
MSSYRNLSVAQNALNNNVRHFSTGLRIEGSKDDATGLAISERFRSQITGYETANKNAQDANNLLQTADGALNETHSMLQRLRQLSITSANEATTQADRSNIQTEVNQLLEEIDNIARTTQYNGKNLLNGDLQGSKATKNAEGTVTQNAYVNLSASQGTIGDSNKLISGNPAVAATYNGENLTFEIRLVANGTSVYAQAYASNSVNSTTGQFNVIASVDIGGAGGTLTLDSTNNITITLNKALTADIGKTAYVRLTNQEAAITTDKSMSFQVRANQGQSVGVSMGDMSTAGLRIQKLDVSNRLGGQNAIKMIDDAIDKLSTQRANIGALQQRISSTISANELNIINQRSAESRIRDVDFAEETLSFTRNNILIQSGTAVLAQANSAPQSVLSLLR